MSRIRTKICGITSPEDALMAAGFGADAIGLVFYPGSKRAVSVEQAIGIRQVLPAFVTLVALFVDPEADEVRRVQEAVSVDCLQFHGSESAEFCGRFAAPYMKALRVRDGVDPLPVIRDYADACAILLDSYEPGQVGGTGRSFDWSVARRCVQSTDQPVVLAGGLHADNVARAMEQVQPWALDVSSGMERAPGIKCRARMDEFFKEVYRV